MPRVDGAGEESSATLLELAEEARPVFARARDEGGLTDAWVVTAWAELIRCRWTAMLEAVEHALTHAHRAGYVRCGTRAARLEGNGPVLRPDAR